MRRQFLTASLIIFMVQFGLLFVTQSMNWLFFITVPLFILGVYDMFQHHHTIIANYPIGGRLRYVMEVLRPKIYQYFIESDTDGTPISRIYRSVVYQRAKDTLSTTPFGTQLDVYETGYEWINHSMNPLNPEEAHDINLRINVGGENCKKPYSLSVFNISAMSFGALSSNAIMALNRGAKLGGFAHNTGEGSISEYHLRYGGDIIWQIGTGYFGCRADDGGFDADKFKERAHLESVKMIEIKLSQGAKPGHGGILPASKNTQEIAKARGVKPHTEVDSPPRHRAFKGLDGLLDFIVKLRELSGGKPVGIKLCVGIPEEFEELCKLMNEKNIVPDFITIDGGEGGTGAAPIEFSNSIGMSLRDGLIIATDLLREYGLRDKVKILASGKILTGFDIIRCISLGADACYSARGMMLALGCIQALECNKNTCPTGVATQDKGLVRGLVVEDKYVRVANYHRKTVESVTEILGAVGLHHTKELNRNHVWRRVSPTIARTYEQLFPTKVMGSKL
ncbi:FMN-binding glutamate synthase family protein [Bacteriovorax sp. BSW11_IV]|uniref:FMN-binding glutamate synthase family protein n=1 Tax=Bacteriovorax sp. BSW11_IV TaxID=1353529 RepID=UPI000551A1BF|nr:FMN-binding glutamate synthase family protein [Bacteriovorax sp. BSW11_IV]